MPCTSAITGAVMNNPCSIPRYRELRNCTEDRKLLGNHLTDICMASPCYEDHEEIAEDLLHEAEHEGVVILINMDWVDNNHPYIISSRIEEIK